jgi:hypothetical protein
VKKFIFFVTLLLLTSLSHTGFTQELLVLSGEKSKTPIDGRKRFFLNMKKVLFGKTFL